MRDKIRIENAETRVIKWVRVSQLSCRKEQNCYDYNDKESKDSWLWYLSNSNFFFFEKMELKMLGSKYLGTNILEL